MRRFNVLFFKHLLLSVATVLCAHSVAYAKSVTIVTFSGPVVGKVQHGVEIFRGIPYAEAPVGKLRWHAPVPVEPWTEPRKVFKDGAICLQPKNLGLAGAIGSEDCLNLNVWVPTGVQGPMPVMVYIHGGFYVIGSSDPTYVKFLKIQDGAGLASRGKVIVVTLDYRLGALGFFVHPSLDEQTAESRSGNFGLMDQLAALKWIQTNIGAFGGDPSRVTLFGQSAGASSVLTLMASPLSEGLFSQAIVQSGYLKDISREKALKLSGKLVSNSGCDKTLTGSVGECLRSLSGAQIISAAPSLASARDEELFVPNFDGWLIPEPLDQAYANGHFRQIPVILGSNSDETANLTSSLYGPVVRTEEELSQTVVAAYGDAFWENAKSVYDQPSLGTPQQKLIQLTTDGIFTCAVSTLARQISEKPNAKVWRYFFTHHLVFPFIPNNGAFHGLELPYVFGSFPRLLPLAKAERDLSLALQDYWSGFARNGNPNASTRSNWANSTAEDETSIEFHNGDGGIFTTHNYRTDRCRVLGL